MKNIVNLILPIMLGATMMLLPACDGILDGIYDQPVVKAKNQFGFIEIDKENKTGVIYIDASDYKKWIYINFHLLTIDSARIEENMQEPAQWDIAIHRYDAKTNGATVLETGFTGFAGLEMAGAIPDGEYVPDVWTTNRIIVDMSGMMEGKIGYAESFYNPELSKWLDVNLSTMPPVYTPSNKVYVVKLKDGTFAALRLRNFMSTANIKGFMTIEYIYPYEVD